MKKFFEALKEPSRLILIIGSFLVLVLFELTLFGNIGNEFFPVLSSIILIVAYSAALAATPVLLLMKKDNIAKIIFAILAGYWVISTIVNQIATGSMIDSDFPPLLITYSVFAFLYGIVLLGVMVLVILSIALKKDILKLIALIAVVTSIGLSYLAGLFEMIYLGSSEGAAWTTFVDAINDYFVIPVVICFGFLYFFGSTISDLPFKKEAKEEAVEPEETKEEPAQEETAE